MVNRQELGDWLTNKANSAAVMRRKIVATTVRSTDYPQIGKMYFYFYDPKYKAKLPYYDKFPLVLPIEPYNNGFLGINVHYLNYSDRKALFDSLIKYRNNKYMDERTKLKVSYDLLKHAKYMNLVEPAIKRYLWSQVESPFIEVHPDEWDKALQLPVALFIKRH